MKTYTTSLCKLSSCNVSAHPARLGTFAAKIAAVAILLSVMTLTSIRPVEAQEVSTGADVVSTYVWRGVAYSGPSLQPYLEVSAGSFTIGGWGSQGYDGFQEMDLYASYSFDFGLSIGITDYYYPGSPWFSFTEDADAGDSSSHAFELNAGYETGAFSFSANYILNEASGAGSAGGDTYFEFGYSMGAADVFAGAGDGWHSSDGEFALVNVGVTASKEIKITESFSLPMFGSVVLNPDSEQLYILAGISF